MDVYENNFEAFMLLDTTILYPQKVASYPLR
jgi:hypothetical protein